MKRCEKCEALKRMYRASNNNPSWHEWENFAERFPHHALGCQKNADSEPDAESRNQLRALGIR